MPIKTVKANLSKGIFKWGKERFINQFGEPGNILKNIK
jgi:hypothetical protein